MIDFWTDWPKAVKDTLKAFKKSITGKEITEVKRRGKNILIFFENDLVVLIHLKMTGHLLLKNGQADKEGYFNDRVNQFIHHIWYLSCKKNNFTLEFSDMRKFGKIKFFWNGGQEKVKEISSLGEEPLSSSFTLKKFKKLISKRGKSNIKMLLLDQNLIAGIGNIYACEILFEAGVNPQRKAESLSFEETKRIHFFIKEVLKKAVKHRGTSDSDYRDTSGAPGGFQNYLKVYNRKGEECLNKNCNCKIEKIKIGQRGTYWCPSCQK
ncbi:MAG: bifunctional DNA-formamidopyrimidine glycosylase/DNA-(apurinic or apyrimidinic site) lyase [Patescibacteria group bacterium]